MYRLARRAVGLAAALAIAMAGIAVAAKGGAGTETITEHHNEVVLFELGTVNPCTGEEGALLATAAKSVFHNTVHENGDRSITVNAEGTVTFTPISPEGVTYSGHFHLWNGASLNNKNFVEHETGTFVLRAANGSKVTVHIVGHIGINGKGEPSVTFHTEEAHCGG